MNKKAFTIVELVIVISILVILSAIWFVSFSSYLWGARDTQRKADLVQIKSALKNYKLKNNTLPEPGTNFNINYGTSVLVKQWVIDNSVNLTSMDTLVQDPKTDNYYSYSKTKNSDEFQLAATLENGENQIALLLWDYQTISKNILPTIVVASSANIDIKLATNKDKFVFDGQGQNLVYQINWSGIKANWLDISSEVSRSNFWSRTDLRNCDEILNSWRKLDWITTYQIVNNSWSIEDIDCATQWSN